MLIKALFSIYYFDLFSLNSNVLTISFFINLFRITLENEIDNYKISIETINLSLPNECILMPHSIYTPSKSFKIIFLSFVGKEATNKPILRSVFLKISTKVW